MSRIGSKVQGFNLQTFAYYTQPVKDQFSTMSYIPTQLRSQFCQLLRPIGHSCAISSTLSRDISGAWSLRKIVFVVPYAGFVSKIIDLANPRVLGLVAGKDVDTGGDTVVSCSRVWCG